MDAVCQQAYPESTCPFTGIASLSCSTWYDEKINCGAWSQTYYDGLVKYGLDAWKEDQVQWCKCCQ